jgi:hypothetical protein
MNIALSQSRIETKYISARPQFSFGIMKSIFSKDPEFYENYIFNIYFDTPSMTFLQDKLNGDLHRQKIRIRWYGETPDIIIPKTAKLECKQKIGAGGLKKAEKVVMPSGSVQALLRAESWRKIFVQSLPENLASPSLSLTPVMLSRYRRRRFVDPTTKTRLSFDDQICSLALSPAMLQQGIHPTKLTDSVIEVKNDTGEMPDFLKLTDHLRITSFSKYSNLLERM